MTYYYHRDDDDDDDAFLRGRTLGTASSRKCIISSNFLARVRSPHAIAVGQEKVWPLREESADQSMMP